MASCSGNKISKTVQDAAMVSILCVVTSLSDLKNLQYLDVSGKQKSNNTLRVDINQFCDKIR